MPSRAPYPGGSIVNAIRVPKERAGSGGGVVRASRVGEEGSISGGGVAAAPKVTQEGGVTSGSIGVAACVGPEAAAPNAESSLAGRVVPQRPRPVAGVGLRRSPTRSADCDDQNRSKRKRAPAIHPSQRTSCHCLCNLQLEFQSRDCMFDAQREECCPAGNDWLFVTEDQLLVGTSC